MDNEQELLRRAKQFDLPALTMIYDQFSPMIYRYAYHRLGDQHLAEDCLADTFDRFLHALNKGAGPQTYLKAYLYRIAHNWITDHYRAGKAIEDELSEELQNVHAASLEDLTDTLDRESLRKALCMLTPDQQQVIVLKFIEGLENDEISRILQKNVGSVKALQHRALAALRKQLIKES